MTDTTSPPPPRRRLYRDLAGKSIAGVASGLSQHLNLPVIGTRLVFVLLSAFDGLGILLYGLLWVLVPAEAHTMDPPGLATGSRLGMRPQRRVNPLNPGVVFSVGALIVGVLWVLGIDGFILGRAEVFWPVLIGGVGVVLVWLQADRATYGDDKQARQTRLGSAGSIARLLGGLSLVGLGISWILATQFGWEGFPTVLGAAVALLGGVTVVAAPWLLRAKSRLENAEREKLMAEARADMAAHLHDSVLQTLALIQRQAHDPVTVAQLARRQERELRTWLYGEPPQEQTLSSALERLRRDVEEKFPIAVEVVCVGDLTLSGASSAAVQAAGEAVVNAAKHSGADRIDVYAEVDEERLEIFVRDRGCGFEPSKIESDRRGVKESIMARLERHDGKALIRSAPGEGTEVKLEVRL